MKNILLPLLAALCLSCNLPKVDDPTDELSAEITVQTSKIFVICPVTFNNTSTGISSYAWNFGDGNTATTQNPEHVFNTPGTFTVSLTVSNGTISDMKSLQVTVYQANTFAKSFGSFPEEEGICAAPTADGGYILVGNYRAGSEDYDIYIVKIDANGNQAQTPITIDYGNHDYIDDLIPTSDGGFAICGYTQSFGVSAPSALLVKLDANGNELWHQYYDSKYLKAESLVQSADGGYYLTGGKIDIGNTNVFVLKANAQGVQSWLKYYGQGEYEEGKAILLNADNTLLIAGHTDSLGNQDPFLIKIDQNGSAIWEKPIQIGSSNDWAEDIVASGDGGFLIAGFTGSIGAGGEDVLLIKVDNNGNTIFADKTFGGTFNDRAYSIAAIGNGQFALTGYKQVSSGGTTDVFVFRVDANGLLIGTEKTYGNATSYEFGNVVIPGADNGLLIIGDTDASGNKNFYVVKTGCD